MSGAVWNRSRVAPGKTVRLRTAVAGGEVPEVAERAAVGGALTGDTDDKRGVEGVGLRAITALARTHVGAFVAGGFFHGTLFVKTRASDSQTSQTLRRDDRADGLERR